MLGLLQLASINGDRVRGRGLGGHGDEGKCVCVCVCVEVGGPWNTVGRGL